MKTYCDTNILTAFMNREDLENQFGEIAEGKYNKIKGFRSPRAGDKLTNLGKCVIDRKALFSDLHENENAMGAVLTSVHLKNISIQDIDGEIEGKKLFNRACKNENKNSGFYKRFCKRRRLKENLNDSNLNDVIHFGSAIKSHSTIFLTDNHQDFNPVKNFIKMEVE